MSGYSSGKSDYKILLRLDTVISSIAPDTSLRCPGYWHSGRLFTLALCYKRIFDATPKQSTRASVNINNPMKKKVL
jgi:hypothetical protein